MMMMMMIYSVNDGWTVTTLIALIVSAIALLVSLTSRAITICVLCLKPTTASKVKYIKTTDETAITEDDAAAAGVALAKRPSGSGAHVKFNSFLETNAAPRAGGNNVSPIGTRSMVAAAAAGNTALALASVEAGVDADTVIPTLPPAQVPASAPAVPATPPTLAMAVAVVPAVSEVAIGIPGGANLVPEQAGSARSMNPKDATVVLEDA
jgi:hypothetical protein